MMDSATAMEVARTEADRANACYMFSYAQSLINQIMLQLTARNNEAALPEYLRENMRKFVQYNSNSRLYTQKINDLNDEISRLQKRLWEKEKEQKQAEGTK